MAGLDSFFLSVQSLQCPLTGLPTTEPPFQGLPLDRATNGHKKMLPVESCANSGLGSQGAPGPGLVWWGLWVLPSQAESSVVFPKKPQAVVLA